MSAWRTPTVVELCRAMREARDYSAAPILADALQDVEYPDSQMLTELRGVPPRWRAEKLVATVYSDETAAAVNWMEQFVRDINYDTNDGYDENDEPINPRPSDDDPHDYEYVIEQGYVGAGLQEQRWGGSKVMHFSSDAGADYFRQSEDSVREFFRNWSLVTGQPGPSNLDDVSFHCAC